MNSFQLKSTVLPIAIVIAGLFAMFFLSNFAETNRPPLPEGYNDRDLVIHGAKLKDFTLGLNGLVADWYWMQSLQYLGGKFAEKPDIQIDVNDLREFDPKLLYPLLENAASFDPHYIGVYEYGAAVLPAIDPKLAIKLVEKGIENNPKEWRLYNHLGYIYWRNRDYDKASKAYTTASEIPGASPVMKAMVAKMNSAGGSRETARAIYSQMYSEAADANSKKTFELFILRLDALDQIDAVNSALAAASEKNGKCISDLREILPRLTNIKLPDNKQFQIDGTKRLVDPSGVPYLLDSDKCAIELDKNNTKLPLG